MTLAAGSRLGPYEVVEPIGSGGMGEVYKARDTKLGREIAIKILPELFARDRDRLARFEREARLLASLNHPNIATIHGLEESDGVHFLVLELVPGETLAERISQGPIPVEDAIPLFKQIAEALGAAHEKGVIHRDLKPANVKVTPEGNIKVLDFGLAKAMGDEAPVSDLSQSPTLTREATRAGVIMGTAPYMSSEQARGKGVDKRTDIWAFGCCLYEALTGQKAFAGETVTDVLAAVVKSEPDWSALPENLSWKIRELLVRSLRKDPARRLHDIADARLDLEDAATATEIPAASIEAPPRRLLAIPFLVGVLIASAVAGIAVWSLIRPEPGTVRRFVIPLPADEELVTDRGSVALSPDGKNIAYVARREGTAQIYLRPIDKLEAVPLEGSEDASGPFFSPDGQWLGFWSKGKLKKIPITGGTPMILCDAAEIRGASWASDDTIYFTPTSLSAIFRVSASGGTPEPVTTLEPEKGERNHHYPEVLPGGKALLFGIWYGEDASDFAVQSLETGERHILFRGASYPHYVPTGHIVFAQRGGTLLAASFDPDRLEITGTPVPVLEDVFIDGLFGNMELSFSSDGTALYVSSSTDLPLGSLAWVDRHGVEQPLAEAPHPYYQPRLSPDGRRLALTILDVKYTSDIWVLELDRATLTRLTFEGWDMSPIWSHDGKRVFFASDRADDGMRQNEVFSKPADGSSNAEQMTKGANRIPTSISSDGKSLVFMQRSDDDTNWDMGMVRLEGEHEPEVLLGTPFDETTGMLSPDDRWLAYSSNESGRYEVYVRPFPGPGGRVQVSTDGGAEPMWSRDGRELFYRNGDKMMAVAISTEPSFTPSRPNLLFKGRYQTVPPTSNYDVAPDGQRFVMVRPAEGSGLTELHVVLNWHQELLEKVPVQ